VDKSDAPIIGIIGFMFVWQYLIVPQFPIESRMWIAPFGTVGAIGLIWFMDSLLKWQAASYTHIEAICRPSGLKLQLFVKSLETKEIIDTDETTNTSESYGFATVFYLAEKIKHPFFNILEYVVIRHRLKYEDHFRFTPGKAVYKGQIVDHPKSAKIILYELSEADVDHLSPVPTFWLKDAPGDYYLQPETTLPNGGKLTIDQAQILTENQQLKNERAEYKRQAIDWHQKAVQLGEYVEHLKGELDAVLGSKTKFKVAVLEYMLTFREAQIRIENAIRHMKGVQITWTKVMALTAVSFAVIGAFVLDVGGVREWFSNGTNQFFVIALVLGSVFVYFYVKKRR